MPLPVYISVWTVEPILDIALSIVSVPPELIILVLVALILMVFAKILVVDAVVLISIN